MDADALARSNAALRWVVRGSLALVVGVVVAITAFGLTYNTTQSLPRGVYQVRPLREPIRRMDIVGFCLEDEMARLATARRYVRPAGLEPYLHGFRCTEDIGILGKHVAGLPGDTVVATADAVWINGRKLARSRSVARDSRGLPIPRPREGTRILGRGEYWMHSPYTERSNDSRVFGPVRRHQLVDRRVPLLVWGDR